MYKTIVWIIAFTASLVFTQTVLAADSCGCGGEGLKRMVSDLKLDDAQKAKIMPIVDQLKTNTKNNWSQMNDLDKQIHQQVSSDKMDLTTLNGLVDQKTKLIGDNMKAKFTAESQIMSNLTAEQRTTLQSKMKALEHKMAEKFKSCHNPD